MKAGVDNLFSYAPGELSQDAFICWLLSRLNSPGCGGDLLHVAQGFAGLLFGDLPFSWEQFHRLELTQQFPGDLRSGEGHETVRVKVDIVAVFRLWNCTAWCLAIEDKVGAKLSAQEQLENNFRVVSNACCSGGIQGVPVGNVRGVFFKTGFDYDWPMPNSCPYEKVSFEKLRHFVWTARELNYRGSQILRDWVEWYMPGLDAIQRVVYCVESELGQLMNDRDAASLESGWSNPDLQYTAFKHVFDLNRLPVSEARQFSYGTKIEFGRSSGYKPFLQFHRNLNGIPFTTYWFDGPHDGDRWRLFFRLDYFRASGWVLQLRDYCENPPRTDQQINDATGAGDRLRTICSRWNVAFDCLTTSQMDREATLLSIPLNSRNALPALRGALREFTESFVRPAGPEA